MLEILFVPDFVDRTLDSDSRKNPELVRAATANHLTLLQYARRAILHEPVLSLKAMDKVSFKDFILSEDFSMEDAARFAIMISTHVRMGLGLLWYKDAIVEALAMSSRPGVPGTSANIGNPSESCFFSGS